MGIEAEIRERLEAAFSPERLHVTNESGKHAGHAGDHGSGESHWHVEIEAAAFKDMGRVQRHRAVHAALGDVMERIHALALDVR